MITNNRGYGGFKVWIVTVLMGFGLIGLGMFAVYLNYEREVQTYRADQLTLALEALLRSSRGRISVDELKSTRPEFKVEAQRMTSTEGSPCYYLDIEVKNAEWRRLADKYGAQSVRWLLTVEVDAQGKLKDLLWSPP